MSFKFIVVLCRIRPFPTLISKIKWLGSELPLSGFYVSLSQLIEVILILMAYKPDGTRQTEALFIISRTIIAFNPLGSVSSVCHLPRSSADDNHYRSGGLWWDWKVNALCYAIIKFKSGEFSNWCLELVIWLAGQSVSIWNLLTVERIKNIISFKPINKEKMKFLNITENKQAT